MFKEGDYIVLENYKSSVVFKVVGFYNGHSINAIVLKYRINGQYYEQIRELPLKNFKLYEPYYRLNKLKNLIK